MTVSQDAAGLLARPLLAEGPGIRPLFITDAAVSVDAGLEQVGGLGPLPWPGQVERAGSKELAWPPQPDGVKFRGSVVLACGAPSGVEGDTDWETSEEWSLRRRLPQALEAVVFPRVTGSFPLVRCRGGVSAGGTGCRVVSSAEVPGCRR